MNTTTIKLDQPIKRGETDISQVDIAKPNAGALRGIKLRDLLYMDVIALMKVLPRVTTPSLTEAEVAMLDPADLTSLGTEVVTFLVPKQAKEAAGI
jgi:hypothetical protein